MLKERFASCTNIRDLVKAKNQLLAEVNDQYELRYAELAEEAKNKKKLPIYYVDPIEEKRKPVAPLMLEYGKVPAHVIELTAENVMRI